MLQLYGGVEMTKYECGKVVNGIVSGIESYGVFVSFKDFHSGLIHISEISYDYIKDLNKIFKKGDNVKVKIIGIDEEHNHLQLSLKQLLPPKTNKNKGIIPTEKGFETLEKNLPIWIEERLKEEN